VGVRLRGAVVIGAWNVRAPGSWTLLLLHHSTDDAEKPHFPWFHRSTSPSSASSSQNLPRPHTPDHDRKINGRDRGREVFVAVEEYAGGGLEENNTVRA